MARRAATRLRVLVVLGAAGPAGALTMSWDVPANGSFQTPASWDPPTVPGSADTALFAVDGTYQVQVTAPAASFAATVRDADVTFDLGRFNHTIGAMFVNRRRELAVETQGLPMEAPANGATHAP